MLVAVPPFLAPAAHIDARDGTVIAGFISPSASVCEQLGGDAAIAALRRRRCAQDPRAREVVLVRLRPLGLVQHLRPPLGPGSCQRTQAVRTSFALSQRRKG